MYYEEKVIDGALYYRTHPDDEFTPYTSAQIVDRYMNLKAENTELRNEIRDLMSERGKL